jgi:hypothetical protein
MQRWKPFSVRSSWNVSTEPGLRLTEALNAKSFAISKPFTTDVGATVHLAIWPRQSSKTSQTNFMTTREKASVREALFRRKMTVTPLQNVERRSRCKRNKWQGPTRSVGSTPFMPACFLTEAERSGNQISNNLINKSARNYCPKNRGKRTW